MHVLEESKELMENTPYRAGLTSDEYLASSQESDIEVEEEDEVKPHIHLPNPSLWPVIVSVAIALAIIGLLISSTTIALVVIAVPLLLIGIIGWAIEDPMEPLPEVYVEVYHPVDPWKYKRGQNVVDAHGNWLGKVQARFPHYVLVERGRFMPTTYYVPQSAIKDQVKNNTLFLSMSEEDLERQELNRVPDDLYEDVQEPGIPVTRGRAQFARRPLSPAETGHYNYGKHWPGVNTDASGSYHRGEILPTPQDYVVDEPYVTDYPIPPRVISSN